MKKTLALLFAMLISVGAMAQHSSNYYNSNDTIYYYNYYNVSNDTINQKTYNFYEQMTQDEMINNINMININLQKFSIMQIGGEVAMIGGSMLVSLGAIYRRNNISNNNQSAGVPIMVIGGGVAVVGYIIKLCSYSKLNKIQIQGTGVVYKF